VVRLRSTVQQWLARHDRAVVALALGAILPLTFVDYAVGSTGGSSPRGREPRDHGLPLPVRMSLGVATFPPPATVDDLLGLADQLMLEAKRSGGDTVRVAAKEDARGTGQRRGSVSRSPAT
jgi:GGDEF domain-containing protein